MHDSPLLKSAVFSGILLVLVVLTHEIIWPLEEILFGEFFQHAVLVYLPLGYWVIVAYYERWWASVYLAPGLAIGLMCYGNPEVSLAGQIGNLVVLATSAPLVFAFFSWASDRENEPMSEPVAWRLIVAVGIVSAIVNSLGLHIVRYHVLPDAVSLPSIMQYTTSGALGLFLCLIVLSVVFRIRNKVMKTN